MAAPANAPSPTQQVFLGWDQPALQRAVEWLAQTHARPRAWDLSGLIVVVPVTRAGRRLLERLTEHAPAEGALIPPTICGMGELPEKLCPPPATRRLADPSHARLTRLHVLRAIGSERLAHLVPRPPEADDVPGWWRLADRLGRLTDELAAAGLTLDDVLEQCRRGDVTLSGGGGDERWQALAAIDQAYHELLEHDGLIDRQRHRIACVRAGTCASDREIILLGAPDLPPLIGQMLEQIDAPITALIHAPEAHRAGFDALGTLVPAYWHEQQIPIDDASLHIVDRTTDQPGEVVAAIARINQTRQAVDRAPLAPDQLSVGLGDETQGGAIRRALQRAGAPARVAAGRDMAWAPPAMLLEALASFTEHRRLDAFAELLRHPDVADYLRDRLDGRDAAPDWLTLLDDYISRSLRLELAAEAFGDDQRFNALGRAFRLITGLLPDDAGIRARKPLPEHAAPISRALGAFYDHRHFTRRDHDDHAAIAALGAIGDVLREHARLDAAHAITPHVTLAQAMRLVLAEACERNVPEPGGEAAVELLGFLELPLDDAPVVLVTSLNEHHLPAAPRGDAFLPDALRRELGLHDARHRYARDKLLLLAALAGREAVALIAPRRAAEGDPLTPSRLLLACDEATRTRRIRRFYDDELADAPPVRELLAPGERNRFLIPHPQLLTEKKLEKLSVTAFRDYLDCPYRFYLKHVRRLEPCDDRAMELDALQFGNVAHEVLEAFAREGPADSDDVEQIAAFLRDALDQCFHRQFGSRLRPALRIQHRQLLERLEAFAIQQAAHVSAGWRIAHVEQKLTATLRVGRHSVELSGKIDRIDVHEQLGHCIIDYKTSDTPRRPEQSHRGRVRHTHRPSEEQGVEGWVDLQLPLYLDLAEHVHGLDRGRTALAQFNLPRKLDEVKLHVAPWDAPLLEDAQRVRDWVIEQICARRFWPPQDPAHWSDAYAWLCADAVLDRQELIRQSGSAVREEADADA